MADAYIALDGVAELGVFRSVLRTLRTRFGELTVSTAYTQTLEEQPRSLHVVAHCHTILPLGELQWELRDIAERATSDAPGSLRLTLILLGSAVLRDGPHEMPHPELLRRKEWLFPMQSLAPNLQHPSKGTRFSELAQSAGRGDLKPYDYPIY